MIEQPSKKVISRFFSDFKLPIPIAIQEYLPYYLELFDKDYISPPRKPTASAVG